MHTCNKKDFNVICVLHFVCMSGNILTHYCRLSFSSSCEQTLGQTKQQLVLRWLCPCPEKFSESVVSMSRMCSPSAIRPGTGKKSNIVLFGSTRR